MHEGEGENKFFFALEKNKLIKIKFEVEVEAASKKNKIFKKKIVFSVFSFSVSVQHYVAFTSLNTLMCCLHHIKFSISRFSRTYVYLHCSSSSSSESTASKSIFELLPSYFPKKLFGDSNA